MAKPMTHTQFVNLLDKWEIETVDNSRDGVKWYNHNRNSKGKWDSVHGIGNHHTGAKDNKAGRDILWNGYAGLPGPLCHGGITADGKVLLNGWGRANHFGLGDGDVLQAVIGENYKGVLKPNEADSDGNRYFYGFEWIYEGTFDPAEKLPKLYRTAVRLNAAICTFHGWKSLSSIGHGEWQQGKWDPGISRGKMMPMDRFRNHVEQAIKEGPKPVKAPGKITRPPLPARPKPGEIEVKRGDTLISIARDKLGDSSRWTDIVAANPDLVRPLVVGEKLTVPKK